MIFANSQPTASSLQELLETYWLIFSLVEGFSSKFFSRQLWKLSSAKSDKFHISHEIEPPYNVTVKLNICNTAEEI